MRRFSVIVPIYNRKHTLERCFENLLGQDFPANQFEIVAINNNSTDGSERVAGRYPRITLFQESKQGSYAARNCGVLHATGEIVAFIDADCIAAPDWLSKIDLAMRDDSVAMVIGRSRLAGQSRAVRLLGAYEDHKDRYVFSNSNSTKYYGHTSNMAVRRSSFAAVGPFIEWQRGADSALVQRAAQRFGCHAIRYDPAIVVTHLEVESAAVYFQKTFIYGRARKLANRRVPVTALTIAERMIIFCEIVRNEKLSAIDTSLLLALLLLGGTCWYTGNFSANLHRVIDPR
ncbi:MAG TPA: glycosyltransferase family A protein [Candidatus Binataceae bacterium]|nr:glycosyltransferase family A protein [Candidatus Binataceae bacterium]